jgi:hypothetical protein
MPWTVPKGACQTDSRCGPVERETEAEKDVFDALPHIGGGNGQRPLTERSTVLGRRPQRLAQLSAAGLSLPTPQIEGGLLPMGLAPVRGFGREFPLAPEASRSPKIFSLTPRISAHDRLIKARSDRRGPVADVAHQNSNR